MLHQAFGYYRVYTADALWLKGLVCGYIYLGRWCTQANILCALVRIHRCSQHCAPSLHVRFCVSDRWNALSVLETIITGFNMDAWYVVCARAFLGPYYHGHLSPIPNSYNLLVTNHSNPDLERAVYWYVST